MQLTPDQKVALDHGNPVPIVIDHTECVVIRRDIYEREKSGLALEDTYAAVLEAWDASGSPADGEIYK